MAQKICRRTGLILLLCWIAVCVAGQEKELSKLPRKGSYLYYPQPAFEDNSFLIEEAFNQEMGILQHIFTFSWDKINTNNLTYSFTQEIPLTDLKHQLSYTFAYAQAKTATGKTIAGFGDTYVSYRPLVWGEKDWAMVIPRFTLILPTGSAIEGLGGGAMGGQFNLAVTKRLSRKIVTHYNGGFTYFYHADHYRESNAQKVLSSEQNLFHKNLGVSLIWYPTRRLNLMLEYVSNFISNIEDGDFISHDHQKIINPGMRYCFDNGRMQIVPGIGVPIRFDGSDPDAGIFLYLSFEPDYLPFYKTKMQ